jgi:16S rRNA (guanine527-N7)-methyltransferase
MTGDLDSLSSGARAILGRSLERQELELFGKYMNLLCKWQKIQRLIGSDDPKWIVDNLFLDSLLFLRVLPSDPTSVADLGSGAGFPGIPIKIVRPDVKMTLIESRQKRVSFLSTVVRELMLEGIRIAGGRAEHLSGHLAGSFEVVVIRCAGEPEAVIDAARRLVAPNGTIVVSGRPAPRPIGGVEWIEVPGIHPGQTRRFGIYRV